MPVYHKYLELEEEWGPLELKFQMVVSHRVGWWELDLVCKSTHSLSTTKLSLQPPKLF